MLTIAQMSLQSNSFTDVYFQSSVPPVLPVKTEALLASSVDRKLDDGIIMVVDDDAGMRTMLETVLDQEGYNVKLVRNGQEALDALCQIVPVLILLDLMMPVMNGWQFLEELKKLPQFQAVPIVLLSASRDLQRAAQNALVKAYLPKPFELDKLLLYIEQYRTDA